MDWDKPFDKGAGTKLRGRGVGLGFKACIAPTTSVAIVNMGADGSCTLYCGTVDMGQGCGTAMAQMVAEVLDLEAEDVRVVQPDTDITPYDMGTLGSRSLFHMGHAVRLAAEDVKAKLAALADELGLPPGSNIPIPEMFVKRYGMRAGNIIGTGTFVPSYTSPDADGLTPDATPFWMVGGAGVEIEVDTETGHIKIERLVNVCDVGTPINPAIVETQISGGAVMQLGFTMFEEMAFDEGQLTNGTLADYRIPGFHDLPATMENEAVDAVQSSGPFGAKGVGESATFGVSPAIANAIHDAVGVRLTRLPLTPEAVFTALQNKEG